MTEIKTNNLNNINKFIRRYNYEYFYDHTTYLINTYLNEYKYKEQPLSTLGSTPTTYTEHNFIIVMSLPQNK